MKLASHTSHLSFKGEERSPMEWLLIFILGALIGAIAGVIMKTYAQQGIIANTIIGIVGAALGRWLFSDLLGIATASTAGQLSLDGFFWGLVGAVLFIGLLQGVGILH